MITILLFPFFTVFSQAPAGYYTPADGKKGDELKASLHNIIKGHTTFPYSSSSTDVWDILKLSDRDPANPANVILFYTGWSVNASMEYNNGDGWNREHVWAKSHGPFAETTQGPGTDCHHLRPCDVTVNSARNNRYFDYGDFEYIDKTGTTQGPTGCKTSSTRDVWEPRDSEKGDVAREIFYMATRYEGDDGFPDLEVVDYIPPVDASPLFGVLSTLIEWNQVDPVDDFEMNRNNVVYSFQNNRNPFIDHPEYVNMIWAPGALPVNKLPQIANISYSPVLPISTDIVTIEATASDPDGSVQIVKLYWGISSDNLQNYSYMAPSNGGYSAKISPKPAGTEIYFVVEVWDNMNEMTNSEITNFSISSLNNVDGTGIFAGQIYPNPAQSVVHVDFLPGESVLIFSSDGKKQIDSDKQDIDISRLKNGLYIVQIINKGGEIQKNLKLVKE